ncbi:metal/formaldehyde-sensitive transcriptional repressor [Achromobacter ruhlandii]|uniref:metal/formaldehyde-sensitive transcriptional repressor n=1 Tax=Achromobacter ruhlandii TaxID=72557 RepID=UPI003B9A5983
MPHSPTEKKRVTTRLRRIQGQALALERAVNEGTECGALLQQLAALRGAATGLMAEVLESHLRETFLQSAQGARPGAALEPEAEIDQVMRIVRSYLK